MSSMEHFWCGFLVICVAKDENRKILINDLNIVNCNSFHFLIISFVLIRLFFFYWLCFSKEKKHRCQSDCQNYKMDINWDIPEQMHWGLTQQREAQLTLFTSAHQKTPMQVASKATENMKQEFWSKLHHNWWSQDNSWAPRCSYPHQDIIESHNSPPHSTLVSLGKKLR